MLSGFPTSAFEKILHPSTSQHDTSSADNRRGTARAPLAEGTFPGSRCPLNSSQKLKVTKFKIIWDMLGRASAVSPTAAETWSRADCRSLLGSTSRRHKFSTLWAITLIHIPTSMDRTDDNENVGLYRFPKENGELTLRSVRWVPAARIATVCDTVARTVEHPRMVHLAFTMYV